MQNKKVLITRSRFPFTTIIGAPRVTFVSSIHSSTLNPGFTATMSFGIWSIGARAAPSIEVSVKGEVSP